MNNTLTKGLRLLHAMARCSGPVGPSELEHKTGIPKSGVHRLLQGLMEEGYVCRDAGGSYRPSLKLWELGSSALLGYDLRRDAESIMEELMQKTQDSVHLAVLDGLEVVYVHKIESPAPVRGYTQIGGRAPAALVATGKAMLAYRLRRLVTEAMLRMQSEAGGAAQGHHLREQMRQVRACGYAVNQGEWRPGVNGIAAPVFDAKGEAFAALGISGPAAHLDERRMVELAPDVIGAAQRLSADGGRLTPDSMLLSVTRHWTSGSGGH